VITLHDDSLGDLALTCENGYVVTSFQLGSPAVREVVHERALADGTVDDTLYVGARAVTVAMTLDQRVAPLQTLLDRITPYVSPRRRPTLIWTLPGSETERRALIVRGVDAPFVLERPKFPPVVCQWVAPEGLITSVERTCEWIQPSSDDVDGRTYDECALVPSPDRVESATTTGRCYDRTYPPAQPRGGRNIVNAGNEVAEWTAAIFGPITNPTITVNGVVVTVATTLALGESAVIDTRERTILRNGDPTQSLYGLSNYQAWSWDQLRLRPGENNIRYSGTGITVETSAAFCWNDTWR
jgi:hypothetical protein